MLPRALLRAALPAALLLSSASALSCLDESGEPVDWWFVLKANGGLDYAYVDAATPPPAGPLQLTGRSLDCGSACALGATLSALIDASAAGSALRVSWNDELPAAFAASGAAADGNATLSSATSGHTKGVLGANATGGFFLTHTLPKFPVLTAPYAYVGSAIYAQTFTCISLSPAELESAAAGVAHVDPYVYASVVPSGALAAQYPTVAGIVAGARSAGTAALALQTLGGAAFSYYVKSGSWGADLWEDLVQAELRVNMLVETWRRPPVMATYCQPTYAWDSINVAAMQYVAADGTLTPFRYTQDHSKLAIAVNTTAQARWLCVADNNRMTSQWARGGGALCWRPAALYSSIADMITAVDGCER